MPHHDPQQLFQLEMSEAEWQKEFAIANKYLLHDGRSGVKLPRGNKPKFIQRLQQRYGEEALPELTQVSHSYFNIGGKILAVLPHNPRCVDKDGQYCPKKDEVIAGMGGFGKVKYARCQAGNIYVIKIEKKYKAALRQLGYEQPSPVEAELTQDVGILLASSSRPVKDVPVWHERYGRPKVKKFHDCEQQISLMQYRGQTLSDLQDDRGSPYWQQPILLKRFDLAMQLFWHVSLLHHGLLTTSGDRAAHRDLKPHNITIDSSGRLHFIDYGFAKHSVYDWYNENVGTPGYTPYYPKDPDFRCTHAVGDIVSAKRCIFRPQKILSLKRGCEYDHDTQVRRSIVPMGEILRRPVLNQFFNTYSSLEKEARAVVRLKDFETPAFFAALLALASIDMEEQYFVLLENNQRMQHVIVVLQYAGLLQANKDNLDEIFANVVMANALSDIAPIIHKLPRPLISYYVSHTLEAEAESHLYRRIRQIGKLGQQHSAARFYGADVLRLCSKSLSGAHGALNQLLGDDEKFNAMVFLAQHDALTPVIIKAIASGAKLHAFIDATKQDKGFHLMVMRLAALDADTLDWVLNYHFDSIKVILNNPCLAEMLVKYNEALSQTANPDAAIAHLGRLDWMIEKLEPSLLDFYVTSTLYQDEGMYRVTYKRMAEISQLDLPRSEMRQQVHLFNACYSIFAGDIEVIDAVFTDEYRFEALTRLASADALSKPVILTIGDNQTVVDFINKEARDNPPLLRRLSLLDEPALALIKGVPRSLDFLTSLDYQGEPIEAVRAMVAQSSQEQIGDLMKLLKCQTPVNKWLCNDFQLLELIKSKMSRDDFNECFPRLLRYQAVLTEASRGVYSKRLNYCWRSNRTHGGIKVMRNMDMDTVDERLQGILLGKLSATVNKHGRILMAANRKQRDGLVDGFYSHALTMLTLAELPDGLALTEGMDEAMSLS